jgi:hypothetical protein
VSVTSSLLRHRLAVAIVAVAILATAGVFLFARPQYRPPDSTVQAVVIPSYVTPAVHGWTWPLGLPGFRIGDDMRSANIVGDVNWATLSVLRMAAPSAHVDPQSLRVLDAEPIAPDERPYLLVSGRGVRGRTCIGAQPGPAAPRFFCPEQLAGHVVVVNVGATAPYRGHWSLFISGVVSAAVTRVDVSTAALTWRDMTTPTPVAHPSGPQTVFLRRNQTWGTFTSFQAQPVPWNARIDFYGAHGKLASLPLRFTRPGSYVYLR